jgi:signal transduction histidine kinase
MEISWKELITKNDLSLNELRQIPCRSTVTLRNSMDHLESLGVDLSLLLEGVGIEREVLEDPNQWLNPIQISTYDKNYLKLLPNLGEHYSHYELGKSFMKRQNSVIHLLMKISPLSVLITRVQKENAKFNHEFAIDHVSITKNSRYAFFQPYPYYRKQALGHECHFVYGLMHTILEMKGVRSIEIRELCCSKKLENLITGYYSRYNLRYEELGNNIFINDELIGRREVLESAAYEVMPSEVREKLRNQEVVVIKKDFFVDDMKILKAGDVFDAPNCISYMEWKAPSPISSWFRDSLNLILSRSSQRESLKNQLELAQWKVKESLQAKNRAEIAEYKALNQWKQLTEYVARNSALRDELIKNQVFINFGKYTSNIVHNLKSKLAGIQGFNELMSESEEIEKSFLQIQSRAIDEAITMVNGLMKSVRYSQQLKAERVHLSELVKNCVEIAKSRSKSESEIHFQMDFMTDDYIMVVPSEMIQVIDNIIKNAAEALPKINGKISIKTYAKQDKIYISVKDNGSGIDACNKCDENKCLTCNRFAIGKTTKPQGTGIGILFVRDTLFAIGGGLRFVVEKEMGPGTEVIITLPRSE